MHTNMNAYYEASYKEDLNYYCTAQAIIAQPSTQHTVFPRNLELHYPYYPTEQDFTHSVLSSGDVVREDIALLSRFSLQWRRLQAGGELLPDLVELYQWLHTDLAHLVSYNKACSVTIKNVVSRAVKKYSPDMGQHLQQLFARVKGEPAKHHIYVIQALVLQFTSCIYGLYMQCIIRM